MKTFQRMAAAGLLAATAWAGGTGSAAAQDLQQMIALAQAQMAMAQAQAKAKSGKTAPPAGADMQGILRQAQLAMARAQAELAMAQARRAAGLDCKRLFSTTNDPLEPYKIVGSCPAGKQPKRSDYPRKGDCACSTIKAAKAE